MLKLCNWDRFTVYYIMLLSLKYVPLQTDCWESTWNFRQSGSVNSLFFGRIRRLVNLSDNRTKAVDGLF